MNADALLTGQYLKAAEFDGTVLPKSPTWTIARIDVEELPDLKKPDATKRKGVIYFREVERGWVQNRTNVECLKALFGGETADWIGKRVTLCTEPTRTGDGIRIHGSPDITQPVTATWKVPKKAAQTKRMVPTGRQGNDQRQPAQDAPQRQPAPTDPAAAAREHWRKAGIEMDDAMAYAAEVGLPTETREDRKALYEALTTDTGDHKAAFAEWLGMRKNGGAS